MLVGVTSVLAVALLVAILSVWFVRPFGLIADYVRYVRAQRTFSLPRLGRRALGTLGAAYDEMRDALSGRNYVADYVQTLTHELKSPLSAIRGAAELLHEREMPPAGPRALRRQHRARDGAHPGAGRSHDGAGRARIAALAGAHRAGRAARAARRARGQRAGQPARRAASR